MIFANTSNFKYSAINEFDFMIKHSCLNKKTHLNEIDLHSHNELEIYINLSGDISFLVESNLYQVTRGDVIISRPGEYHHCVYNSDKEHDFFWILIDIEKNKDIFDLFLKEINTNLISPYKKAKDEIIKLCTSLLNEDLSDFDKYYYFFKFLRILKSNINNDMPDLNTMPDDLVCILEYIDKHLSENIQVLDISKVSFLSPSTIERRFKKYLNITPLEFIHKRKMLLAAELLRNGESVLNAGLNVGYSDNSYFINIFKRYHGITPFEYKKINSN